MDQDLALLIDRWRDGELDADEKAHLAARLRADAVYAGRFFAELRYQGCLAGLLRRDGDDLWRHVEDALAIGSTTTVADQVLKKVERVHPRQRRPTIRWWPRMLVAASVLLVLSGMVAGLAWMRSPIGVTIAMLDDRTSQAQRREVPSGGLITCGNDQRAQMDFTDGSQVELGSGGTMQLTRLDRRGARLDLEEGPLKAVIAKQQPKAHFVVKTQDAVLTVLGTRFTATRLPWGTRVAVTEGLVKARRAKDGAEIEVPAGMWAEVRNSPRIALSLRPLLPPLPTGAVVREPVADSIVVGGKYAHENRGDFKAHMLTSYAQPPDEHREYYLCFDLTGVRRPVAQARLRLHITRLTQPGMRLMVEKVEATWGERTINWNSRPAAGPVVGEWRPGPDDQPIDLTAAVNAAGDSLSLRIRAVDGTALKAIVGFATREALEHERPRLVLVPEHSTP